MENKELKYCLNCIQMTNHLGSICQKCKEQWKEQYPLNTFNGETRKELENFIYTTRIQAVKERVAELVEEIEKELPNILHKYGVYILLHFKDDEPLERRAKKNELTQIFINLIKSNE